MEAGCAISPAAAKKSPRVKLARRVSAVSAAIRDGVEAALLFDRFRCNGGLTALVSPVKARRTWPRMIGSFARISRLQLPGKGGLGAVCPGLWGARPLMGIA